METKVLLKISFCTFVTPIFSVVFCIRQNLSSYKKLHVHTTVVISVCHIVQILLCLFVQMFIFLRIFYLQKLCSWVYWHEMHYLCRGYVYMNYFSVCDTKFKWLKKCLFNFFECFPFLSVPSLDFSLFFMHKKTNLFLIHLVCKNLFQLLFAQPTVLSFVHDIISLAQH